MKYLPKSISAGLCTARLGTGILGASMALLLLLGANPRAVAQGIVTDNFDSGVLTTGDSGWQVRNVLQGLGGYVNDTFPANGAGKALRLKRGSADMSPLGFPQEYGTGRAWLFRTNDYSDFYVAMDLLDWNNLTNQALVLIGRGSGFDETLGTGFPPGLGTTDGYVMNYDCVQDGTGTGDRLGGQLQINIVTDENPFATITAADLTLIPGHPYRMVFKGTGAALAGHVYDLEDLTQPIVTIACVDEGGYSSGKSGIVTFHRDQLTHPNLTDLTLDNFYCGPSDPNADIAPAIRHSVSGTPQVVTRTPTKRYGSFHPAASGISFTARTFTTNQINASATKLYLNGADVSASLAPFAANGSTVSLSTAAGTLAANTVYAARIELVDTTGTLKSTNTFWFDTFTSAFVTTSPAKTVEIEDYNYSNGVYQLDPIPVSGMDTNSPSNQVNGNGVGYYGLSGTPDVDFFKPGGFSRLSLAEYRSSDRVQITQGSWGNSVDDEAADVLYSTNFVVADVRLHDTQRPQYAAAKVWEYQVRLTSPGDWMNYTRSFASTNYLVYLRCGSFGATTIYLDRVTSDPTTPGQTTVRLGTFNVSNHHSRLNYQYEPLMAGASPAVVSLSGTGTLRLTLGGTATKHERLVSLDYLLFVPTPYGPVVFDDFNDGNDAAPLAEWVRYNPIQTGSWSFPGGNTYRLQSAPSPDPINLFMGRAGSYVAAAYGDFCVVADVVAWDDTVRQAFGVMARVGNPGPGTTTGYAFVHDRINPASSTAGDMSLVRLDNEFPVTLKTGDIHFEPGKTYRLVFTGVGDQFRGQVYEVADLNTPAVDIVATDATYTTGMSGLLVANYQPDFAGPADATFDNFLATTAEPRITVTKSGSAVTLSWPLIPFRFQSSPSLSSPVWTTVTSGVVESGGRYVYTVPATGAQYYRLVYP